MTTPEMEPEIAEVPEITEQTEEEEERKRRMLLILLILLLVCLCCIGALFARYLMNPQPIPDMLIPTQVGGVCYPPTYQYSINNVSGPVAVALSPDEQRIYVAEGSGDRLVKAFDREGNFLFSFAPPGTDKANREPKYMAVDAVGRVYLVDRISSAIDIYDPDGNFIDAIIGQHLTLTKYLKQEVGPLPAGTRITHYEGINKILTYRVPGQSPKNVKVEIRESDLPWSPLGLRFDAAGNLIYTDNTDTLHSVRIIPAAALNGDLSEFNPQITFFGTQGPEKDQFDFPQTVSMDADGNFYISDGNNARIDVWTPDMQYKTFFGFGSSLNGALNLPRGTWMGRGDCLHVADSVGSLIRVYDVSGEEPVLAYELGEFGIEIGQFNYPVDVFIDGTGRLFVADRANNRIQVWSY